MLLAADLTTALELSDRSEIRVRAPGSATVLSLDAETAIRAQLALSAKDFRATLAYAPRLTLWDIGGPAFQPTALQGGDLRVEWRARHAVVSIEEGAEYGGVGFGALPVEPGAVGMQTEPGMQVNPGMQGGPPRIQAIPSVGIVDYLASTTTLASDITQRGLTMRLAAGYALAGGATADARTSLPLISGPFAEINAEWAGTRVDRPILRVAAAEYQFDPGPESMLGEADAGWRHRWSRVTETRLAAGGAVSEQHGPSDAAHTYTPFPVVEAELDERAVGGAHVDMAFTTRLGPMLNRLYGVIDERAEASVTLTHHYRRLVTHGFFGVSQSTDWQNTYATSLVAGEVGVARPMNAIVALDAGVRTFWQRTYGVSAPLLQSTFYVGVTLPSRPLRF
jgi:hypothetical protein